MSAPDFARLGRETPWSAAEWESAWNSLSEPRLWPTVVEMANKIGTNPRDAADQLQRTLLRELRRS